jgi:hypothetical protein
MAFISRHYHFKEGGVNTPTTYLDAKVKEFHYLDNRSRSMWILSADKYINVALLYMEQVITKSDKKLPT